MTYTTGTPGYALAILYSLGLGIYQDLLKQATEADAEVASQQLEKEASALKHLLDDTNTLLGSENEAVVLAQTELMSAVLGGYMAKGGLDVDITHTVHDYDALKGEVVSYGELLNDAELRLAEKRKQLEATIAKLTLTFEATNAELIEEVSDLKQKHSAADQRLRNEVLVEYGLTGKKQIHKGLSIRINKAISYDPVEAVKWAIERKMPEVLKVDDKAFKKFMTVAPQDFVEVKETASAVVSFK